MNYDGKGHFKMASCISQNLPPFYSSRVLSWLSFLFSKVAFNYFDSQEISVCVMEEVSNLVFLPSQETCVFHAIIKHDSLALLQKQ